MDTTRTSICRMVFYRELGNTCTKQTVVKKLLKSRLQKTNLSEFKTKLIETFNDLVEELYNSTEDQYSKCECVFEIVHRKDIGFLELPPSIFKLRRLFREEQGIFMRIIDNSDDEC